MINRAAILLKYKAPAVQWINDADPCHEDPGISLESVNEENTIYLVSEHEAESPEALKKWIALNYQALFERELDDWYTDEGLWPNVLDLKLFYEWFEVECHTEIIDTVELPIEDDEI